MIIRLTPVFPFFYFFHFLYFVFSSWLRFFLEALGWQCRPALLLCLLLLFVVWGVRVGQLCCCVCCCCLGRPCGPALLLCVFALVWGGRVGQLCCCIFLCCLGRPCGPAVLLWWFFPSLCLGGHGGPALLFLFGAMHPGWKRCVMLVHYGVTILVTMSMSWWHSIESIVLGHLLTLISICEPLGNLNIRFLSKVSWSVLSIPVPINPRSNPYINKCWYILCRYISCIGNTSIY